MNLLNKKEKNNKKKEILEKMKLPEGIRKLKSEEQNTLVINHINEIFASKILENEEYIQDIDSYQYSRRQNAVLENFKCELEKNSMIDAYWEIWDFIDNYGDTTYKKLLTIEAKEVIKDLQLIYNKINNISNYKGEKSETRNRNENKPKNISNL